VYSIPFGRDSKNRDFLLKSLIGGIMHRIKKWQIYFGIGLIFASFLLYFAHYLIFRDSHHIFIYLLGDIAFVPIEVLLVTIVIHSLLSAREKQAIMEKMHMIIGAFFSEVGTELIKMITKFDTDRAKLADIARLSLDWTDEKFTKLAKNALTEDYKIDANLSDIEALRGFLVSKRDFMVRLLENPMLLEHDEFTDLLWAVFHLTEELSARESLKMLPLSDIEHLGGDIKRVYGRLLNQWLLYLRHLKTSYPFLYSLCVRTNPLNPEGSAVVRD